MSDNSASPDKPSPARMYDYYLGGKHNFEIDRQAAKQVIAFYPDMPYAAKSNRAFLRRVVSFLSSQGINQFLDLGSGIPTEGNVHEVAQAVNPQARTVYVEIDPVAVAYSQQILEGQKNVVSVVGDVREPDTILNHSEIRSLIDFKQPVAVLMVAMLHFITNDAELYRIVRAFRDAVSPGSYLVITHSCYFEGVKSDPTVDKVESIYSKAMEGLKIRTRDEVLPCFEGVELVEPGFVDTVIWRPEEPQSHPKWSGYTAGVARKS
ncbi:MAG: SAM-dependent methyltransferase [Chloroflexota bacterium]